VLALLYLAIIATIVPIILWSFSFRWAYPSLLPAWSLAAWDYVFQQNAIIVALIDSIAVSSAVTLFTMVLGFTAAKALGTREFRGKVAVELLVLLPAIVPAISAVMGMSGIFTLLKCENTFLGVVLAQIPFGMPYMIMGLASAFKNYDMEYEQAASTLGASRWRTLIEVTVPAIFPALVVSCLFTFVVSWSQYLLTLIIGGSAVNTLPLALFALMGSGDYGIACAVSIIFILPVLVLLVLSSKYLTTNGISNGGVNQL